MNDDEIREAIYQGIRDEIQESINEYVDQREESKKTGLGFAENEDEKELKVNVDKREIEKILKEYKKITKNQKSNFAEIKKLSLLDQHGRQL
tara:strand:+ start:894 stop:1169 length:276 start_codon:yes stop_codon:yes gene_type:complete